MRSLTTLLALLLFMMLALSAHADDSSLSLKDYVDEVLERSPRLHAAALQRKALLREAEAADAYPDPTLSIMLDRVPNRVRQGGDMPMIQYQLSQMFPWPGKLDLMRGAVVRQADAAQAEIDMRRLNLRLEAKRSWYMLVLNASRRQINRAERDLAAMITTATLARYGAALGSHHEAARAQVEVAALDVERLDLEGELVSIVAMLNALRDRPVNMPIADPTFTPSPDPEQQLAKLTALALAKRPELRMMGAMQEEARTMASLARKEPLPDLMGSVWMTQMLGGPATFGVMIGSTIPFFGVGKQDHRARAFDARAQSAAQDQAAMRAMIRFEVADALAKVKTASRRLDPLRDVVLPRARESFQASLAGYAVGNLELAGLLDARRLLQKAELGLTEAEIMREVALAELERAVGVPIPKSKP